MSDFRRHDAPGYSPPRTEHRQRELARLRAHEQGATPIRIQGTAAAADELLQSLADVPSLRVTDAPDLGDLKASAWVSDVKILVVGPYKLIRRVLDDHAERFGTDLDAQVLRTE